MAHAIDLNIILGQGQLSEVKNISVKPPLIFLQLYE